MKRCRKCGGVLNSENWYKCHKKKGNRICKNCLKKYVKRWQNQNRERYNFCLNQWVLKRKIMLVKMLGSKCIKCGYCKNYSALVFHHKDKNEKESNREWLRKGFEQKIKEGKIELLCANCHMEEHHPEYL